MKPPISQCGKVIAYDFAPRPKASLEIRMEGTILYCDDRIMLARYEFHCGGTISSYHLMADLETGKISHL